MKSVIVFSSFILFFVNYSIAQDTLIMRNNTIVLAKVLEISRTEVKYRLFNLPDGPLRIESKSKFQAVKYANGFKEEFSLEDAVAVDISNSANWKPVNNKITQIGPFLYYRDKKINQYELNTILLNSNDISVLRLELKSQRAKKLRYMGIAAIPLGALAAFSGLIGADYNSEELLVGAGCFAMAAIPLGIIGGINKHNYREYRNQALDLYNLNH